MEKNKSFSIQELSARLVGYYQGDIVVSDFDNPKSAVIQVEALSDILVRISLHLNEQKIELKAILSEESGDVHMIIQEKVTDDYILNGVRGFLCQKPNIHGGYLSKLDGLYFHVLFNHFSGKYREVYFFGKPTHMQAIAV